MVAAAQRLPPGAVLYIDHAHHLTPLTLTYHATASRHLTTGRSDVIPPSTTVEIDSAYCPRCLTFHASASSGVCQKDTGGCKDCPVCFSPVSISIDENKSDPASNGRLVCHYLCGQCQWSSRECGVTSNADKLLEYSTSDEMDAATEKEAEKQRGIAIAEISKDLEICLQQRIQEKNKEGDAIFDSITNMWGQREQEEQRRKRLMIGTTSKGNIDSGGQSWSLETLEKSLLEKKRDLDSPYTQSTLSGGEEEMRTTDPADTPKEHRTLPTSQQSAAQMTLTATTPQSRSDLFPLPVPFRTRVSRRCRAELADGRTGILIKPKLNPLEGDTSLRAGHGQWWKKDSSAVHVVPRVQLCRHGVDSTGLKYAALLKVKNPTLNMIRLRLSGTQSEDGKADSSPLFDQRELQNILVDSFSETFVQGHLCAPESTAKLNPTDFFVLDPADDPFLDIGKGREDDPSDVRDWDAMTKLGSLGDGNKSQLRLLATQGDTAWVELALCNVSCDGEEALNANSYLAVPLAMQIEVGNGSWDASLIKQRGDLSEGEKDLVTLNLVTLLR